MQQPFSPWSRQQVEAARIDELEMWNSYGHPNIHQSEYLMKRINALRMPGEQEWRNYAPFVTEFIARQNVLVDD